MEYLLTYGWAILAVMVIGAAFWSLGAFSEPGETMSAVGFTFFKLMPGASSTEDGLTVLIFKNTLPQAVKINAITSTVVNAFTKQTCNERVIIPETVPPDGTFRIEVMSCIPWDQPDYKYDISLEYQSAIGGTTQTKTETGAVKGRQQVIVYTTCLDSDNDVHPSNIKKGTTCGAEGCESDYCIEDSHASWSGNYLLERFCFGNTQGDMGVMCSSKCVDGACVP